MMNLKTNLLALALGIGLVSTSVSAKTILWDMPNEYNQTSIPGEGDLYLAKKITEKTNGEIKITHHFGGALGYRGAQMIDAVGSGAVPLGGTLVAPLGGISPVLLLSSIPFLATTPDQAKKLMDVAIDDYRKVYEANNQRILYASPWPPSGLWGKKALDNKEALAQLKVRVYDPNGISTFRAIGASPVQVSLGDLIPQVSAGAIDAVLTSADGGAPYRMWELLPYFTEINYSMPLNITSINMDVWNKLTPSQQQAVQEAADETSKHQWIEVAKRVEKNYAQIRENKGTVVTGISEEYAKQLHEAGQGALKDWTAKMGPRGQEILDAYYKSIK